ncbi:MAG: endonuclease III domain-containing protein [Syntrophomonadaceae bacterium]|jgi:endonuclease-3 related protein
MTGMLEMFNTLLNAYGRRHWWPAQTPFEMMVGAILTQNTAWANVEKAISNFGDCLSPEYIAKASPDELARIIRPSGYYNQKLLRLKALTEWYKKYAYDIDKARQIDGYLLREELLAVKGIGPETADSILLYALDKPFFVIDAYTKRILYRLGYNLPAAYDTLQLQIQALIPQDIYIYQEFHALIVEHAKRYCRKNPLCPGCPLEERCSQCI